MVRDGVQTRELTPRELEILLLTADGRSAPAIAHHLHLSPGTVNTHLLSSFEKLGVGNRAAAIAAAAQSGLLETGRVY